MFSSLEEGERKTVIEKCYWPLLQLAERGYKFGIELTGITLRIINSIDPLWIKKFKSLLNANKLELIGSGYAQIIGPLVPAEVNDWNQKLGIEIYREILGLTPKIALVNEMAYSAGIVEHYVNNGYEAMIMEWNNPRKYHPEWENEWRYFPKIAVGTKDKKIPIIWADSIAFQKFQRYAHGETTVESYLEYLETHQGSEERFFPLYASDAEVFNYRPGRFKTEVVQSLTISEWDRIEVLLENLTRKDNILIVLPSTVLLSSDSKYCGQKLSLESTEQPIPVKKQEKYNITRWALTGRNDLWLNTTCFKFYTRILELNQDKYWKKLCYLWSSDLRTHITSNRWEQLLKDVKSFEDELGFQLDSLEEEIEKGIDNIGTKIHISQNQRYKTISNSELELILDLSKGSAIHSYKSSKFNKALIGTLEHGYFEDIEYGADFFTGHSVINQLGKHKITDLVYCNPQINEKDERFTIITDLLIDKIRFEKSMALNQDSLILTKRISLPNREKQIIHPFHFTFFPEAWDKNSLYFETHNGGNNIETFLINDKDFHHGDNHSYLISSKHGLGNTKGVVIIGDKEKRLVFTCNLELSFLIPSVFYKKVEGDKFLLRLVYSAQEIDETFKIDNDTILFRASLNVSCETSCLI